VDVDPAPAGGGHDWPVIALVASAGGLDALEQILGALPKTLDASVVVLLHQAPDRDSRLVELLGRRSILPVDEARDGVALRPGRVTVVPPGRHLLIGRGLRTTLIDSGASPPNRPSGDLLLATLATAAGARVLAVILSGGGHDGATGAAAVRALGGTVVATNQASSQSFSMPDAAIRRGIVDHVVPLEGVADLLWRLTTDAPD
jgi:two-component system, chemotaxis family, protein-glutamate methylesterase/glutaminase